MNVKEILIKYLKNHGYDGLFSEYGDCGCDIEDLIPCDEACHNCEAGYKTWSNNSEYDVKKFWLIGPKKENDNYEKDRKIF